jgi:hypothetical protein
MLEKSFQAGARFYGKKPRYGRVCGSAKERRKERKVEL